jgi:hypothetical protein
MTFMTLWQDRSNNFTAAFFAAQLTDTQPAKQGRNPTNDEISP